MSRVAPQPDSRKETKKKEKEKKAIKEDQTDELLKSIVRGDDADKVKKMLDNISSVKLSAKGKDGNIPLHIAAKGNNNKVFELLLNKNSETDTINSKNEKGKTPLHLAAEYKNVGMVQQLIKKHADINKKDHDGFTPLFAAVWYNCPQVVEMLLQRNAKLDDTDKQGKTIVHLATEKNRLGVLEILLNSEKKTRNNVIKGLLNKKIDEKKAPHSSEDKDCKDLKMCSDKDYYFASTPVQLAAYYGYLDCMNLLLANEAEVCETSKYGKTALHLAAAQGNASVVERLLKEDKLRDEADGRQKTALHDAIRNDKIVAILIDAGAGVDAEDKHGRTPISYAAEEGMVGSTKILLRHGADVNLFDLKKTKPIHYAAKNGHSEVFRILASHKSSDIKERDGNGDNCLDLAIENNHVETVLIMIQMESGQWEDFMRSKSSNFDTPMRRLIRKMPDVAREVFNKCVKIEGNGNIFEVEFSYEFLDDTLHLGNWTIAGYKNENDKDAKRNGHAKGNGDDKDGVKGMKGTPTSPHSQEPYTDDLNLIKTNHPLMIMVTSKRRELLDHPLVSALLKKKWTKVGLIFQLLNFVLYALYLAVLTGFALDIKAPFQFQNISVDAMKVCSEDNGTHPSIPVFASYAKYGVFVIASIELLIEMVEMKQMFSCKLWLYFLEVENVIEWITCATAIIFVVNLNGCSDTGFRPQWQWSCGTISVFLAWINMLFIIRKFEWFGIYVVMLYRIMKVFMKFFLVFFFLIVAFAVSFHGLFQNQEQFSTFWISVVKTTAMMIGEIDFGTIFIDEVVHYEYISYVFFYIFMIFMTIVVINLLVGLAVENIQEFQKEADLARKEMQVKFALELERISTSSLILKGLNFLRCRRSAKPVSQTETLRPSKQNWLQRKFAESWKLTERDIKVALKSENDSTSREIARLDSKFNTLETNLIDIDSKLEKILQTLSGNREEERS